MSTAMSREHCQSSREQEVRETFAAVAALRQRWWRRLHPWRRQEEKAADGVAGSSVLSAEQARLHHVC
jgi:hypothetical protein